MASKYKFTKEKPMSGVVVRVAQVLGRLPSKLQGLHSNPTTTKK
jgi:hypothetical protein